MTGMRVISNLRKCPGQVSCSVFYSWHLAQGLTVFTVEEMSVVRIDDRWMVATTVPTHNRHFI